MGGWGRGSSNYEDLGWMWFIAYITVTITLSLLFWKFACEQWRHNNGGVAKHFNRNIVKIYAVNLYLCCNIYKT